MATSSARKRAVKAVALALREAYFQPMANRLWQSLDDFLSGQTDLARLPTDVGEKLLSELIYRPWFDKAATAVLTDWLFPLSRAWAAALEAGGDLQTFSEKTGIDRPANILSAALARQERDRLALAVVDNAWFAALFGDSAAGEDTLAEAERTRRSAAYRLEAARSYYLPAHFTSRIDKVRWDIAAPQAVDEAHGGRLSAFEHAYALPTQAPVVERSLSYAAKDRRHFWLRYPSPVAAAGTAWAHVTEPLNGRPFATLIFLHGIGVEQEYWPDRRDTFARLIAEGWRIIQPEAPSHGRRRQSGYYGGEPILAGGPMSVLDFMQAAVLEAGSYIRWAREAGGPVVLGGVSLGALTSQIAGHACRDWPQAARPDGMFLVAPGGNFLRIVLESALATGIGLPAQMDAAGWTAEKLRRWQPLAETMNPPALPSNRIIAALGSTDAVTHYHDAHEMIRTWQVPEDNVFVAEKGHFSLSLDSHWLQRALSRLQVVVD